MTTPTTHPTGAEDYEHPELCPTGHENVAALVDTMRHIDEHPQEWNQRVWMAGRSCGTAACFAGRSLLLKGWRPVEGSYGYIDNAVGPDSSPMYIRDAAKVELGLTHEQADALFWYANKLDDLRRFVAQLTDGAYTPPDGAE